ncbi:cellulosome protein dockerin type I [Xylanimonas oleitrophica]|uniref:Cellulosome protein dockerin type I n=1 Tax=Xylanimonas oleitrophica TaxID=2607479 RepID=A0A2W5WPW4_9MICO|nr:glycoside hydrolase [Xylanimonas oleitrophica]PZR52743.1 cellulosome protein dockerin type I [Xylanimonas oleitrophica]
MRPRTRTTTAAATLAGALALTLAAGPPGTAQEHRPPKVVVDWQGERQTIDGFGGAFAFHKAGGIQRVGEPLTSELLDMVLTEEAGIDLDIVRVMVGDGGIGTWGDTEYDGPSETIEPEPGVFVWDQPDWPERKDDFDAHQVWLMQQAQARGVDTILASVWSPPAWMKQNGSVAATGTGTPPNKIRPDMHQAFADYLAEYVLGYEREFGIRITHVSPSNEPDLSTSYSSSEWSPQELRDFVRDHLGPTFERRGVDAQIVLGEAVGFDERWVLPTLTDPEADRYVDVVAAHAYSGLLDGGTRAAPGAFATSHALGKSVWQTEYMNQGSPRDRLFVNNTITDGLRYAELIANLFDETRLSAYFWWWPVANNGADGSDLVRLVNTGTPQSGNPTENGQYRVFKRYYTIGQYSRFVQPGSVMIDADKHPADGVTVTAYKDEETGGFAVVAINHGTQDTDVTFDLDGGFPLPPESKDDCKAGGWRHFTFPTFRNQGECVSAVASGKGPASAVVPFRTSASENMARLDPLPTRDREFTTTLRAGSVTTFVPQRLAPPALADRKDVFSTYPAPQTDTRSSEVEVGPVDGRAAARMGDGAWLGWRNVNFADGSAAGFAEQKGQLRAHVDVRAGAAAVLELRVAGPDGAVVASLDVPPGGGETWRTVSAWVDTSPGAANGFQDLYLVARGPVDVAELRFSD